MKRILLACFLLTATCTFVFTQQATAQSTPPAVTQTSFMAKVNAMDTYIGANDMTNAQTMWEELHQDMIQVLGVTKASIYSATTPADVTYYTNIMTNQRDLYTPIWQMHTDLVTNRTAMKSKLTDFAATIY